MRVLLTYTRGGLDHKTLRPDIGIDHPLASANLEVDNQSKAYVKVQVNQQQVAAQLKNELPTVVDVTEAAMKAQAHCVLQAARNGKQLNATHLAIVNNLGCEFESVDDLRKEGLIERLRLAPMELTIQGAPAGVVSVRLILTYGADEVERVQQALELSTIASGEISFL